jgi:hypothetical protein
MSLWEQPIDIRIASAQQSVLAKINQLKVQ